MNISSIRGGIMTAFTVPAYFGLGAEYKGQFNLPEAIRLEALCNFCSFSKPGGGDPMTWLANEINLRLGGPIVSYLDEGPLHIKGNEWDLTCFWGDLEGLGGGMAEIGTWLRGVQFAQLFGVCMLTVHETGLQDGWFIRATLADRGMTYILVDDIEDERTANIYHARISEWLFAPGTGNTAPT